MLQGLFQLPLCVRIDGGLAAAVDKLVWDFEAAELGSACLVRVLLFVVPLAEQAFGFVGQDQRFGARVEESVVDGDFQGEFFHVGQFDPGQQVRLVDFALHGLRFVIHAGHGSRLRHAQPATTQQRNSHDAAAHAQKGEKKRPIILICN